MSQDRDPGLGSKFTHPVRRLMNPDGSYNIKRIGGIRGIRDFYKYLLEISWWQFLLILFAFYIGVNSLFALGYLWIGLDGLSGINPSIPSFWSAFFFSSQTFTTLGYGALHPNDLGISILSSFESFIGLLSIALATGLLYGRFSKPSTRIAFSKNAILTNFKGGKALMFKLVNKRHNVLLKTKVSCIFILDKNELNHSFEKEYHPMKLETDFVLFFPLTWTIVHVIDEESPLFGLSLEELKRKNAEMVIFLETFDETFGHEIIQKHSYSGEQWLENVKFDLNFRANKNGQVELFVDELDKLIED